METVVFKSNSKKDMTLLINLARKIGIEVEKIPSNTDLIDENDLVFEEKVERNLGLLIKEGLNSGLASKDEVLKVMNKWK